MAKILSFNLYKDSNNKNPFKLPWESFKALDNFTKMTVIVLMTWIFLTPFIVSNYLLFNIRGEALDNIQAIYYNPSQESGSYLSKASSDLKKYLEKAAKRSFDISTSTPPATGIFLTVDPSLPELQGKNDEAFQLKADESGIRVTGKTALAVRDGVYTLLEIMGFRKYFKNPIWEVYPDSIPSLAGLNKVIEPSYIFRTMAHPGIYREPHSSDWNNWFAWNRLGGAVPLGAIHSYRYIAINAFDNLNPSEKSLDSNAKILKLYDQYPQGFCQKPTTVDSWQLNIDDPKVIEWGITYAREAFQKGSFSVVVSPNDGGGFCFDSKNYQLATDKVFGYANKVIKALEAEFPGRYVSLYNYADYSCVPGIELSKNIFVSVASGYNYCGLAMADRLTKLQAKGVITGIREYYNVGKEPRPLPLDSLAEISWYYDRGVRVLNAENQDGWGAAGLYYYIASHLYWDPHLDVKVVTDEFYTKAFGPAREPMKRFYDRWWVEGRSVDEQTLAIAYKDLKEAQDLARDNPAVLARIRHMQIYVYGLYKLPQIDKMTLDEIKETYKFVCKIIDTYVFHGRGYPHALERDYFRGKFGWTFEQMDAYRATEANNCQYSAQPTPGDSEIQAWFDEGYKRFASVEVFDINNFKLFSTPLKALGDTTLPKLPPVSLRTSSIILYSAKGAETVTLNVKGDVNDFTLIHPDTVSITKINGGKFDDYIPVSVSLPQAGTYRLIVTWASGGRSFTIKTDSPMAILTSKESNGFLWSISEATDYRDPYAQFYFYVPSGTPTFILGASTSENRVYKIALAKPDGTTEEVSLTENGEKEWVYKNPPAGVWKIKTTRTGGGTFNLQGIPPFAWIDAKNLLVADIAPAPTSSPIVIKDLGDEPIKDPDQKDPLFDNLLLSPVPLPSTAPLVVSPTTAAGGLPTTTPSPSVTATLIAPTATPKPTPTPTPIPTSTPTPTLIPTPTPIPEVTIQGRFKDTLGNDFVLSGQRVTLSNSLTTSSSPDWYFNKLLPATYTVTASDIPGYIVSHAVCVNCAPPTATYTNGNSVTVSLLQTGNYADIYFKYSPIPTPTPPDTTKPAVSITFPLQNSVVAKRSRMIIAASASDNVKVKKVDFYIIGVRGELLLCSDYTAPYSCSWYSPSSTSRIYELQARAYDTSGNSALSPIVKFRVK